MKFIDLYAGIGGFRYALESFGHECVFSSEINPHSLFTYRENFPNDKFNHDISMDVFASLTNEQIDKIVPDHDILTAGFPCQTFSIGGKKTGFDPIDARGTQFFNILKILEVKKPKYILLENVSNIVNHDNGKTFLVIKSELKNLNYGINDTPIIISPHNLGIPQKRNRAFFIATLNKQVINKDVFYDFPIQKTKNIFLKNLNETEKYQLNSYYLKVLQAWEEFCLNTKWINDLKIPDIWIDEMVNCITPLDSDPAWRKEYLIRMNKFYMMNKKFIDIWIKKYDVLNFERRERKFEWRAGKQPANFKNFIITFRTSGVRVSNNLTFPTLVAMAQIPVIYDKKLNNFRWISKREAANLQSFPKNMKINPNDHQAFKQFGNAVNVDVIKYIFKTYIENEENITKLNDVVFDEKL